MRFFNAQLIAITVALSRRTIVVPPESCADIPDDEAWVVKTRGMLLEKVADDFEPPPCERCTDIPCSVEHFVRAGYKAEDFAPLVARMLLAREQKAREAEQQAAVQQAKAEQEAEQKAEAEAARAAAEAKKRAAAEETAKVKAEEAAKAKAADEAKASTPDAASDEKAEDTSSRTKKQK